MVKVISHADQRNAPPEEEILIDESEAAEEHVATAEEIAEVERLSREQYQLEYIDIEKAKEELGKMQAKLKANKEVELPKALAAIGRDNWPLNKGWKVEIDNIVRASIPSPKNKDVENALEKNRIGIAYMDEVAPSMVDTIVTIRYPKGTEKELKKLISSNKRRKNPLELELTRTVHSGSLKSWVAKRDAAGLPTDDTKISIQRIKIAELVKPKGKKDEIPY